MYSMSTYIAGPIRVHNLCRVGRSPAGMWYHLCYVLLLHSVMVWVCTRDTQHTRILLYWKVRRADQAKEMVNVQTCLQKADCWPHFLVCHILLAVHEATWDVYCEVLRIYFLVCSLPISDCWRQKIAHHWRQLVKTTRLDSTRCTCTKVHKLINSLTNQLTNQPTNQLTN